MRSGDPFSLLVPFDEGFPDAAISWVLRDGDGTQLSTGTLTPAAGDVSATLLISGASNTLANGELFGNRELSWSYTVSGTVISNYQRYDLEAFLPYGVSREGVRTKLGLTESEAPDEEINLVLAYMQFAEAITDTLLAAVTSGMDKLRVRNAVEALAALQMIPALRIKLSKKEVQGINQFQRADIDWDAISASLNEILADAYSILNPDLDPSANVGALFMVVVRSPDPITGA